MPVRHVYPDCIHDAKGIILFRHLKLEYYGIEIASRRRGAASVFSGVGSLTGE